MEEYCQDEKLIAMQKLAAELDAGWRSGEEQGYIDSEDVFRKLEAKYDN